jgi:hypothetical protein
VKDQWLRSRAEHERTALCKSEHLGSTLVKGAVHQVSVDSVGILPAFFLVSVLVSVITTGTKLFGWSYGARRVDTHITGERVMSLVRVIR